MIINFEYLLVFHFEFWIQFYTAKKQKQTEMLVFFFFYLFMSSLKLLFSDGAARPLLVTDGNRAFFIPLKIHFSFMGLSALTS